MQNNVPGDRYKHQVNKLLFKKNKKQTKTENWENIWASTEVR